MIRFLISDGSGTRAGTLPRWPLVFGIALTAAFGFVLVAVGIGLALLLAPVVLIGGLIARWRFRKFVETMRARSAEPFQRPGQDPDVIEGEYRVVDEDKRR